MFSSPVLEFRKSMGEGSPGNLFVWSLKVRKKETWEKTV